MRRAQATARSTGQNIERSLGGLSARVSQSFAGIRVAAAGLGLTLGASFLVQQARQAFEFAASLTEAARSIGVTVEQLQILRRAAIENGASVEGMERAMSILQRTLGQARAEVPAAVQAFRALRIDPEQFATSGEALRAVMDAIRGLRTQSEQAAAAQRLFGRGAAELIPFLVQGAQGYDRVAVAAREAGLVTEEQARRADEAADKLAALGVTLRTNLASAIADFIPTAERLVAQLIAIGNAARAALGWMARVGNATIGEQATNEIGSALLTPGGAITAPMRFARYLGRRAAEAVFGRRGRTGSGGVNVPIRDIPSADTGANDLDLSPRGGGGGGGGAGRAEAERKRRLREEEQFQSDLRREQITQLEEQRQRTNDYVEQNHIQDQIITLNREEYKSDLDLQVALGDLTRERANQRLLAYDQSDIERRLTIASSEHENYVREQATIAENQYNQARETLQHEEALADTAEERRRIGLQLLALDYDYRQLKLQQIVRERNVYSEAERLDAQAQLDRLGASRRSDEASLMRGTRGPLEEYLGSLPTTAARAREALQGVAVNGLQSITDGLTEAIAGTRKWGDVFKNVAAGILADLIRIQIQQRIVGLIGNAISSLIGGSSGGIGNVSAVGIPTLPDIGARAAGGPVLPGGMYLVGEHGPEILRMGNAAGHVIANDNIGGGGNVIVNQTFAPNFAGNAATKQEMIQLASMVKPMAVEAFKDFAKRR